MALGIGKAVKKAVKSVGKSVSNIGKSATSFIKAGTDVKKLVKDPVGYATRTTGSALRLGGRATKEVGGAFGGSTQKLIGGLGSVQEGIGNFIDPLGGKTTDAPGPKDTGPKEETEAERLARSQEEAEARRKKRGASTYLSGRAGDEDIRTSKTFLGGKA